MESLLEKLVVKKKRAANRPKKVVPGNRIQPHGDSEEEDDEEDEENLDQDMWECGEEEGGEEEGGDENVGMDESEEEELTLQDRYDRL